MEVLRAFTSKYALALYEAVARRVRLKHVFTEPFALDDFRELLGVEPDDLREPEPIRDQARAYGSERPV